MDWQLAAPTLIELILCVGIVVLVVAMSILYSQIKHLRAALSESEQNSVSAIARIEALAKNANNQQTEAQARTLVITRHLQELDEKQTDLESQLRELKLQDPSLRLYQRAADLVKQGASIDEIIEACDIPRAEAEMLVMVHKQNN
jgi:CHASE3 domain sensor protein